jgi:hypothetical protein
MADVLGALRPGLRTYGTRGATTVHGRANGRAAYPSGPGAPRPMVASRPLVVAGPWTGLEVPGTRGQVSAGRALSLDRLRAGKRTATFAKPAGSRARPTSRYRGLAHPATLDRQVGVDAPARSAGARLGRDRRGRSPRRRRPGPTLRAVMSLLDPIIARTRPLGAYARPSAGTTRATPDGPFGRVDEVSGDRHRHSLSAGSRQRVR